MGEEACIFGPIPGSEALMQRCTGGAFRRRASPMARALAGAFLILWAATATAVADVPVNDCDRLAANPPDPDRVADGVPRAEVDLPAAIKACEAAVAAHPNEARFAYQLGRVHFYNGDTAHAVKFMKQAADLSYRQAYFVLGLLIANKREGIEHDICQLEDYWVTAARMDHIAARVSYIRHLTKGSFGACPIQASPEELVRFIDIPAPPALAYYSKLLVLDLKEDLEGYLAQ